MELLDAIRQSDVAFRLGWALVHALWMGTGLAIVFTAAMLLLRRRSANARYVVGCATLIMMVAIPAAVFVAAPARPVAEPAFDPAAMTETDLAVLPPTSDTPAAPFDEEELPYSPAGPVAVAELAPPPADDAEQATWWQQLSRAAEPAMPWIVLLWAAGVLVLSARQIYAWIAAQWLTQLAVTPAGDEMRDSLARLARALAVSRPVRLLESALVRVPTVIGWLKPVILLPVGLVAAMTPQQVQAILAHELAHIRRYDYLVNLLQSLAETLLFYHPAVWLISRRVRGERENCCDDLALAAGAERVCYAESLLHVARASAASRRPLAAAALGAADRPSALRKRITRMLGGEQHRPLRGSWPLAAAALAICIATAGILNCAHRPAATAESVTSADAGPAIPPGTLAADVSLVSADEGTQIYKWRIDRMAPARLVYGVVEGLGQEPGPPRRLITAREGKSEQTSKFLTLRLSRPGGRLRMEIADECAPPDAGGRGACWDFAAWPDGAELVTEPCRRTATVTDTKYMVLWQGRFVRDGETVSEMSFVIRLASQDDPVVHILAAGDPVDAFELPASPPVAGEVVVYDPITTPVGQLAYMPVAPRMIAIQAHRYVSWQLDQSVWAEGMVLDNAVAGTSARGPLSLAVAFDADHPNATEPTLMRINTTGELDFRGAPTIRLTRQEDGQVAYGVGPGVATVNVDGEDVPVTFHGRYIPSDGGGYLKLGLECVLQGFCEFGDRTLAVRIADGDGNARVGDPVEPMLLGGRVVGRTPGDTVNVDLGDGTFTDASTVVRAMYGQPLLIDGVWWLLRVSDDRTEVSADRLDEQTGWVRIDNQNWEAMFIGEKYVYRQYYNPSAETFPLPPGRYIVIRYKQWAEAEMDDSQPAILVEPPFGRNGPFLLDGREPTFEVAAGQTAKLPIGTPLHAGLTVGKMRRGRGYRISFNVTDDSGTTPAYIRTGKPNNRLIRLTVLAPDGRVLFGPALRGASDSDRWTSSNDEPGPLTAVAAVEAGGFGVTTEQVTFGPDEGAADTVRDSGQDKFDMHLEDSDLRDVLRVLGSQRKVNIVAMEGVAGTVTLDLYGVTLEEALTAITASAGYTWTRRDNIIYVGTAEQIANLPAEPTTQPASSRLEFRIAPSPSALGKANLASYRDWLKAGGVGFWWKGASIAGRMPDHAWLPIAGELTNAPRLVTGEYEGQKYVLVSVRPGQTMLPGEDENVWGLAKVYATVDGSGRPAIGFELDDRGAELFAAFTKANINNALAIVVDGKVVSAPILKTALGKQGMITGRFSEQEVKALVNALKAGMPPTATGPSPPQAPSAD